MDEPWQREDNPFNLTITGYLGKKREGMLKNEILTKAPLGRAKLRKFDIPSDITVFGDTYRSPWTAAHALRGWTGNLPAPDTIGGKKKPLLPIDYLQLNRATASAGLLTCEDVASFRQHKRHIRRGLISKERPMPKIPQPNLVYGKPLEASDPIHDVLTFQYQKEWIAKSKIEIKQAAAQKVDLSKGPRPNRASVIRPVLVKTGELPPLPWRAKRFVNNAKPQISTFRRPQSPIKTTEDGKVIA